MAEGFLHQLDSSVVVELFTPETRENRLLKRLVRAYLVGEVGRTVRGLISVPALGELLLAMRERMPTAEERWEALETVNHFLNRAGVEINSPTMRAYSLAVDILQADNRVEPSDALRVAEAIEANAVFVTLDQKLLGNRVLRERFGATIVPLPQRSSFGFRG